MCHTSHGKEKELNIKLRDYQAECIDILGKKGKGSYLVQMATGLGKTVTFANGEVVEVLAILDKGMEGEFGALGVCGFEESALFPTTRYANVSLKVLV